jgi:CRP-like cAMP-binding protein
MKKSKTVCDLHTCLMCQLSQPEWLAAIGVHRQNFIIKKGEPIFKEGDEVKGIFFVFTGIVKVHKHWGSEKEIILRFAKAGNIIGHRGLGKDLVYPVSATAIEESTVCFINLDFFKASLKVNSSFLFELMMFYATELKESEQNMRNLAHMPAKGRIAQALLTLDEKFGRTGDGFIDIPVNRQDLASFAGTTYETLFKVMNELVEEQSIALNQKQICIANIAQLRNYISLPG